MNETLLAALATFALRGTFILGVALVLCRLPLNRGRAREWMMKAALLMAPLSVIFVFLDTVGQGIQTTYTLRTVNPIAPSTGAAPKLVDASQSPPASVDWAALIILVWLVGVLFFMIRHAYHLWAFRQIIKNRQPLDSNLVGANLNHMVKILGLKPTPEFTFAPRLASPVVVSSKEICFPKALIGKLTPVEFDAVVAHELGHIQRRDQWWLHVNAMLRIVFFFHPLQSRLIHRLHQEIERQCDRLSVQLTKDPIALAKALVKCASGGPSAAMTVSTFKKERELLQRTRWILEKQQGTQPTSRPLMFVPLALFALLAILVPGVLPAAANQPGHWMRELGVVEGSGEHMRARLNGTGDDSFDGIPVQIYFDNAIIDTRNPKILTLNPGSSFGVTFEKDGVLHEYTASHSDGMRENSFRRNGVAAEFDSKTFREILLKTFYLN